LFRKVGRYFFGDSEKEQETDEAEAKKLKTARDQQRKDLLEERQKTIEANQAHALKSLELARLTAAERQQTLHLTATEHKKISDELFASSKSLENANSLLDQLGHEKVDLVRCFADHSLDYILTHIIGENKRDNRHIYSVSDDIQAPSRRYARLFQGKRRGCREDDSEKWTTWQNPPNHRRDFGSFWEQERGTDNGESGN
jgi:hypothetical protein